MGKHPAEPDNLSPCNITLIVRNIAKFCHWIHDRDNCFSLSQNNDEFVFVIITFPTVSP